MLYEVITIKANYGIPLTYDDSVIQTIIDRCQELESGGRMIDAILTNTMLPAISTEFLRRTMEGEPIEKVNVTIKDGEFVITSYSIHYTKLYERRWRWSRSFRPARCGRRRW